MAVIQKTIFVPYTPEQMFRLVDAIESYPEFLLWCSRAQEVTRTATEVTASLTISHCGLSKTFTTHNTLFFPNKIVMELVDGPFKNFHGVWEFNERGSVSTEVSLHLQFDFESKLVALAFGGIFNKVANQLVDCFLQRANEVYSLEKK